MTLVAEREQTPLPSGDVATSKYPPHRNVRVEDTRWNDFAEAVGKRKRSAWLSDFIDAVNRDPEAWRTFREQSEAAGELFSAALARVVAQSARRKR